MILLETVRNAPEDDEAIALLREIIATGDEELLQEFWFLAPLLPAALSGLGTALGYGAAAGLVTLGTDAVGITDGWYDNVFKYGDPFHYGIEGAKMALNTVGVDEIPFFGKTGDYKFFGKDAHAPKSGWLIDIAKNVMGKGEPQEIVQQAKELTAEEGRQAFRALTPEKRREALKKAGMNDKQIDAWEAKNMQGKAPAEGDGDRAATLLRVQNAGKTKEKAVNPKLDDRFANIKGDPTLVNALKMLLSIEAQGATLDRDMSELKNILIRGEAGASAAGV